jgi:hypothetical protein
MTHAWQDKRQTMGAQAMRGNVPSIDNFEWELEAFRNQNRYLHEKLLKDPAAAMRSSEFPQYQYMLADYPGWRDMIVRTYLQSMPAGIGSFADLRQLQDLRRQNLAQTPPSGLAAAAKALLRLVGLKQGDASLAAAEKDQSGRTQAFVDGELPGMRVDGFMALTAAYDKDKDYRRAFESAVAAESAAKGTPSEKAAAAQADRLSDRALAWVKKGQGDPDNLAAALSAVTARYNARNKTLPPEDNALFLPTYLRVIESHLETARASQVKEIQKRERDIAQSYVAALDAYKPSDVADPALRKRLVDARAAFGLNAAGKP